MAEQTGRPMKTPMKTRRALRGQSFSGRNPTVIGAIGLVVIAALLWAAFNAAKLPIIDGGTVYSAAFSEAAGLKPNDEVRVAGVKVGTVSSVGLEGNHVKVTFRVKHAFIGDQSTLSIKIKTLLGAKYLAVDSVGDTKQKAGSEIGPPCKSGVADSSCRTMSPFDIYPAFQQLTQTVGDIDTRQLAKARGVTGVLADRDKQLTTLISDGNLLLAELTARREAIHALLDNTS